MRRRCVLSIDADREIDDQVAWYAEHAGARVASRFYAEWKLTLQRLLARPRRGRVVSTARPELLGLRSWVMRDFPFLVYYREVSEGIEVVHILHGARNRGQ